METDTVRPAGSIEIAMLTTAQREQAVNVLVEAFKTEETTAYHLDMERPSTIRGMAVLDGIFVQLYLEAGRPIIAALRDGNIAGIGILRDPRRPISRWRATALFLPASPRMLLLFSRRPLRFLRILKASKHPKGLTKPFFTFEALGVHPDHQGAGVGKALMREAQAMLGDDPAVSGIYLNTGSEKNQRFYESLGYTTLRIVDLDAVKVYHMFWRNPAFGQA